MQKNSYFIFNFGNLHLMDYLKGVALHLVLALFFIFIFFTVLPFLNSILGTYLITDYLNYFFNQDRSALDHLNNSDLLSLQSIVLLSFLITFVFILPFNWLYKRHLWAKQSKNQIPLNIKIGFKYSLFSLGFIFFILFFSIILIYSSYLLAFIPFINILTLLFLFLYILGLIFLYEALLCLPYALLEGVEFKKAFHHSLQKMQGHYIHSFIPIFITLNFLILSYLSLNFTPSLLGKLYIGILNYIIIAPLHRIVQSSLVLYLHKK